MALTFDYTDGAHLVSIVDDLVPEHVRHNYPGLMAAVKVYAEYLEHINNSGHFLNALDHQRDIDRVESALLQQLQKEIGAPIPRRFEADPRKLYKRVSEFYRSRGTPDSIKAFFRILFDDEAEIYFPKEDMFIPSDGRFFDYSDDVVSNKGSYTPTHTYTMAAPSLDTIEGNDDNSRKLIFDNPIVFVNDAQTTAFTPYVIVNETTNVLDYSIVFDSDLTAGDTVEVYNGGAFTTNDGFPDDYKKIQDSFFYQKFSYVLRTGANIDSWKNSFNRLVHPAGFIFFGEILLLLDSLGQAAPLIQPGFQVSGLAFPIVINPVLIGVTNVKTKQIGTETETASYIELQHKYHNQKIEASTYDEWFEKRGKFKYQENPGMPRQLWQQLKFLYGDQINQIDEYTFEDAINKTIRNTMTSITHTRVAQTGDVSLTSGSDQVTGNGTTFTSVYSGQELLGSDVYGVGDTLIVMNGTDFEFYEIESVDSDTTLTLTKDAATTLSNTTFYKQSADTI